MPTLKPKTPLFMTPACRDSRMSGCCTASEEVRKSVWLGRRLAQFWRYHADFRHPPRLAAAPSGAALPKLAKSRVREDRGDELSAMGGAGGGQALADQRHLFRDRWAVVLTELAAA